MNGVEKPLDDYKVKQGVIPAKMTDKGLSPDSDYKTVMVGLSGHLSGHLGKDWGRAGCVLPFILPCV